MKFVSAKFFIVIFTIIMFVGVGYYYRQDANFLLQTLLRQWQPCQRPLTYSIANFDPLFGLTEAELLNNIKRAEEIWESEAGRQLFEYSPTGEIKINLVYDYRQKATDELKDMGIVIHDDRSTYDSLKARYDSLIVSYNQKKAQLEAILKTYEADKSAFEKDVKHWNSRGGAPKEEYDKLEQRKIDINNQVATINQAQDSLNELVDTINSEAAILNKLVATLNLQVSKYNTVGSSAGKIFDEGEYIRDANGTEINIFQYNDENQLVRVLAHEFGHALGLEHLENPKAIMYYLNEGINDELTADDLAALKTECKIK